MKIEVGLPDNQVKQYTLKKSETIVGRSSQCDIRIPVSGISRKHLKLVIKKDQLFVEDLGSSNGTILNGEKLRPGEEKAVTTFFPIEIGPSLSIRLCDEEVQRESNDSTDNLEPTVVKRRKLEFNKDLPEETKTTAMRHERTLSRIRRNLKAAEQSEEEKKQARLKLTAAVFALALVVVAISNTRLFERLGLMESEISSLEGQGPTGPKEALALEFRQQKREKDKGYLELKEQIETYVMRDKCLKTIERVFCSKFPVESSQGGFLFKDGHLFFYRDFRGAIANFLVEHPLESHEERILKRKIRLRKKVELEGKKRKVALDDIPVDLTPMTDATSAEIIASYLAISSPIADFVLEKDEVQTFTTVLYQRGMASGKNIPILSFASIDREGLAKMKRGSYLSDFRLALQASELQAYRNRVIGKLRYLRPSLNSLR